MPIPPVFHPSLRDGTKEIFSTFILKNKTSILEPRAPFSFVKPIQRLPEKGPDFWLQFGPVGKLGMKGDIPRLGTPMKPFSHGAHQANTQAIHFRNNFLCQ